MSSDSESYVKELNTCLQDPDRHEKSCTNWHHRAQTGKLYAKAESFIQKAS